MKLSATLLNWCLPVTCSVKVIPANIHQLNLSQQVNWQFFL